MLRCLTFLLLRVFVDYVASSSLPEMVRLTSNTTTVRATCTGFQILQLRPLYRDCSRAVDFLPSNRLPGNFHTAGEMDEWQLPVTETVRTCEVSVRITPYGTVEASSWGDLKAAARRVTDECRVKAAFGDVTGGTVSVGRHGRIQIWVKRRNGGGEMGTNV